MARADLVRTEMPFRKSAAGPGLQVVLEADRTLLVGELQRDHDTPGSISNGVSAGTGVVPVQPLLNVAGYADVMALGIALAAQNVDEPLPDAEHRFTVWHVSRQPNSWRI